MLGTEIDEKLTFGPHIARTAERAAVALRGVGLLKRRRAGLAPRWARQLVVACVLPRLVWASAAWLDPAIGTDRVSPLVCVWKEACACVCGGTRTAAGEALAVEAGLQPVRLLLRKSLFRLALRALAAPASHLLHHRVRLARATPTAVHAGPLHCTLIAFPLLAPDLNAETLFPDPFAPWAPDPSLDASTRQRRRRS